MSVRRMCEKAGVHYPTVCNWKRKEPKQFRIMQALVNVEPEEKQEYKATVVTDIATRTHTIQAFDDNDALDVVRHMYDREYSEELVADISFE
jgi:hypothetical protein